MPAPVSSQEPIGSEPDSLPGGFDAPLAVRALEAAGTGVCIADARRPMLPLVWANDAFSARTGLPREEIAGGSCRMLQWADTGSAELGCAARGRPRRRVHGPRAQAPPPPDRRPQPDLALAGDRRRAAS